MEIAKKKYWLYALCFVAYFSSYIGRLNFAAVMVQINVDGILTKEMLGNISAIFFITYGAGQLISGIAGDKLNPFKMIFIGLVLSGVSNIALFFFNDYSQFMFFWGLNGFVQSMIWSPILKICVTYYKATGQRKFTKNMAATVTLGTLTAYALTLFIINFTRWQYVFLSSGVIILSVATLWLAATGILSKDLPENYVEKVIKIRGEHLVWQHSFFKILLTCGILLFIIPVGIHGILKDGVSTWVPLFLYEKFDVNTTNSIALTMIIPILNTFAAYIAAYVNKKIENELNVCLLFFGIALLSFITILLFGDYSMVLSLVCLSVIICSMFGVNYMAISIIPLYFAKMNKTSFVTGLLNSSAYLFCGIGANVVGTMVENYDWAYVLMLWAGLVIFGIIILVFCRKLWDNKSILSTNLVSIYSKKEKQMPSNASKF